MTQTKKTVTAMMILVCIFSCNLIAKEDSSGAKYFVQKTTWSESMLASRKVYLQNCTEYIPELGPWYKTAPMQATKFADVFFPEHGVDINAKDEYGKALWIKKTDWQDGKIHRLKAGNKASTYLYRVISSDKAATVTVSLGTNDGIEVWLNGRKLLSYNRGRPVNPDAHLVDLQLNAGENEFLMKVYNISAAR